MKKTIINILWFSLALLMIMALKACIQPEDLTTKDAKTGGLIVPQSSNVPYKLNATPKVDIDVLLPKGPGIASIEVHNIFTDTGNNVTNDVIIKTIDVGGANTSANVTKSLSVVYNDLIANLLLLSKPLPSKETDLAIGDYWTLSYTAVMNDGRKIVNNGTTNIGVANKYAGNYQCTGVFHHPTAGDRPINEEKYLTPIDAFSCYTGLGDLGSSGYDITITVNNDNSVTVSAGPNHVTDVFMTPGGENSYDPQTGIFILHYFYVGSTGNRVIDEKYTPIP